IAPYRNQAETIAWEPALKKYAQGIPGTTLYVSRLEATFATGASVRLFGADNVHALRGMHLDGVVLDEFAQMSPQLWKEIVRPTRERRRGFAIFIGTTLGRNHFYELYEYARQTPDWYADVWTAERSGVIPSERLAVIREEQGPDLYAQEYECSFAAAIVGAYYARELERVRDEGRIRTVPWQPNVQVETWWDLGYDDSTAIIFTQTCGREIHVIDYVEARGQALAFYAREIQRRPYLYATHHLPHDAEGHELGQGKTITQQLRELKIGAVTAHARPKDIAPGIEAARRMLSRCWFDETKCRATLVEALTNYRRLWDDKRRDFKPEPFHDWSSHGADAFRLLATHHEDAEPILPRKPLAYRRVLGAI